MPKNVAIVGAGLVGTLLAVYLARRKYNITVYERRADPRKGSAESGRLINLALSERGLKALESVGVANEIESISIPMRGRMIHSMDGKTNFLHYGTDNQAIYSVSRALLNEKLLDCADRFPNVALQFDERFVSIDFEKTSITLENQVSKQRQSVATDQIVAADGAYSAVRLAMQLQPQFNFSQSYLEHGYKELNIQAQADGTHALEKNALHIWPRQSYMLIALPNLDGSFTCTLFFPFKGKPSFEALNTPETVQSFFQTVFPDIVPLIPDLEQQFFKNPTSNLVTMRCHPWSKGNILLIGDAAHAIVPFYGQGMNCGFEDCRVLDDLLDEYANTEDVWKNTINAFEDLRKPDADAIAELALYNFIEMRDLTDNPDFLFRKKIEAKIHKLYPTKWIPLYGMVTFSPHIRYSEALRIGQQQKAFMDVLMQLPNLASTWESNEFEELLAQRIASFDV